MKYLDPKNDLLFKKVFGEHPDILRSFLNNRLLAGTLFLVLAILAGSFGMTGCNSTTRDNSGEEADNQVAAPAIEVPVFNADSAYYFVDRQVAFGPRVPNSNAHQEAAIWLTETMERFADTVYVQETRVRAYNGTILNIRNIIGVFQPELRRRILLCAHWDSRPYADYDPDPEKHYTPIDGANDGASGVGVLLEVARLLSKNTPGRGIDIILFDAEDYGNHRFSDLPDGDNWALGSQYWARNPHRPDYNAHYGILLDMVGAGGATFKREGYSMLYAPDIVRKVWENARKLGYGQLFQNQDGSFITDDHYYINKIRNIPTINIIHQDNTTPHGFFPEWHTTADNMDVIDPYTLKAVGETVLHTIYH